jgi:hypothetical protein
MAKGGDRTKAKSSGAGASGGAGAGGGAISQANISSWLSSSTDNQLTPEILSVANKIKGIKLKLANLNKQEATPANKIKFKGLMADGNKLKDATNPRTFDQANSLADR